MLFVESIALGVLLWLFIAKEDAQAMATFGMFFCFLAIFVNLTFQRYSYQPPDDNDKLDMIDFKKKK
jgi:hypothetical protein